MTAALAGKRVRQSLGGEWAVGAAITQAMVTARKNRAADDLLCLLDSWPTLNDNRQRLAPLLMSRLRLITLTTKLLPLRALALRMIIADRRLDPPHFVKIAVAARTSPLIFWMSWGLPPPPLPLPANAIGAQVKGWPHWLPCCLWKTAAKTRATKTRFRQKCSRDRARGLLWAQPARGLCHLRRHSGHLQPQNPRPNWPRLGHHACPLCPRGGIIRRKCGGGLFAGRAVPVVGTPNQETSRKLMQAARQTVLAAT